MKKVLFALISRSSALAVLFLAAACTKGRPAIEALSNQPQINLNQTSFSSKNISTYALNLAGTCYAGVTSFEISSDAGSSWRSVSSIGSFTQDCSGAGTFTVTINNLGQHFPNLASLTNGEFRNVLVRGVTSFGPTEPGVFQMTSLASSYTIKGYLRQQDQTITNHNYSNYTYSNTHNFAVHDTTMTSGYKIKGALK
jgi:hypothetical protein